MDVDETSLMACLREELRKLKVNIPVTVVQPFFLTPPQNKKHWEVKSVLPEITADTVAASTVAAVKQDLFTLTLPTYIFFLMYLVRVLPAKASDMWKDLFHANIDTLGQPASKEPTPTNGLRH